MLQFKRQKLYLPEERINDNYQEHNPTSQKILPLASTGFLNL